MKMAKGLLQKNPEQNVLLYLRDHGKNGIERAAEKEKGTVQFISKEKSSRGEGKKPLFVVGKVGTKGKKKEAAGKKDVHGF